MCANVQTRVSALFILPQSSRSSSAGLRRYQEAREENVKPKLILLAALAAAALAATAPSPAQTRDGKSHMTLLNAERQSIELTQGMSAEEVERLLGKPKRTALKQGPAASADPSPGSLQWNYTWTDTSQRDSSLQVVFTRKPAGQWLVESWGWNAY
jgi:preprotein translocase subunit Sec61beta